MEHEIIPTILMITNVILRVILMLTIAMGAVRILMPVNKFRIKLFGKLYVIGINLYKVAYVTCAAFYLGVLSAQNLGTAQSTPLDTLRLLAFIGMYKLLFKSIDYRDQQSLKGYNKHDKVKKD